MAFVMIGLNKHKVKLEDMYDEQIIQQDQLINLLLDRVFVHSDFSGYYKFPENFILNDLSGKEIFIKDTLKKSTMVLFVDKNHCSSCIKESIIELQERNNSKESCTNAILIVRNFHLRELKAFLKVNKIDIPSFIADDAMSVFLDKIQEAMQPAYFLLNRNLEVSKVFFPNFQIESILNDRFFNSVQIQERDDTIPQSEKGGSLEFIKSSFDLGEIKIRKKYSFLLEVKNIGQFPCFFKSVKSSCSCVLPTMDLSPLRPDSIRKISVDVFPSEKGKFSKSVTIQTNSESNQFIKAWIIGDVK